MSSPKVLAIINILVLIIVFALAITSAVAAAYVHKSSDYINSEGAKSCHKFLTYSAVIGMIFSAIIIAVIVMLFHKGKLKKEDFSNAKLDVTLDRAGSHQKISVFIIILLISNLLIFFVLGGLAVAAAIEIEGIKPKDNDMEIAYQICISNAIIVWGGAALAFVCIILATMNHDKERKKKNEIIRDKIIENPGELAEVSASEENKQHVMEALPMAVKGLNDDKIKPSEEFTEKRKKKPQMSNAKNEAKLEKLRQEAEKTKIRNEQMRSNAKSLISSASKTILTPENKQYVFDAMKSFLSYK